jgi:hypothetical protein
VFTLHYWYTRSSTVGLSLRGQWLAAGTEVLLNPFDAAMFYVSGSDPDATAAVVTAAMAAMLLAQPLLALKALSRVEVGRAGWRPYVRRGKATHRERTSARLDMRTGWLPIATVGTALQDALTSILT